MSRHFHAGGAGPMSLDRRQWLHRALAAGGFGLAQPGTLLGHDRAESLRGRARAIHCQSTVIAIHDHNPIAPDVPKMLAGGVTAKVYQLGLDVEVGGNYLASAGSREGWAQKTMASLDQACCTIQADPDRLLLATTAEEIRRAKREGKVAIMFGVEGGKLLEGKLEWLDRFYDRGLRELQLTWAVPNQIVERSGATGDGLTSFGQQVVRRCDQLGVIVCLTHIPRKAFDEVMAISTKPLILSHEAIGVGVGQREVKAIGTSHGVVGIHFYQTYLGPNPTPQKVVDQVDRIADAAGIETVSLGMDFFPTAGPWRDLQIAQGSRDIVWAIPDIGQVIQVTEALLLRNYSEGDIEKVLGGNFLRVCQAVFGEQRASKGVRYRFG